MSMIKQIRTVPIFLTFIESFITTMSSKKRKKSENGEKQSKLDLECYC